MLCRSIRISEYSFKLINQGVYSCMIIGTTDYHTTIDSLINSFQTKLSHSFLLNLIQYYKFLWKKIVQLVFSQVFTFSKHITNIVENFWELEPDILWFGYILCYGLHFLRLSGFCMTWTDLIKWWTMKKLCL